MPQGKRLFWLLFTGSGVVAYVLVFWEAFWPLGRVLAGWYAIIVVLVVVTAVIVTVSIKLGPFKTHPGLIDFLILLD